MSFITTFNWHTLFNKINEAKECIYIALPGIDEALAETLVSIKKETSVSVNICIDNSEDAIRNGYGEAEGIQKLIENKILLKECKGNRISFLIVDNQGFIFYPESRIFTDAITPSGPNTLEIDAFTITRLINYFFAPENILEKEKLEERFERGLEQQRNRLHAITNEISDGVAPESTTFINEDFLAIQKSLKSNPPLQPDLQRKIKTYNAKIQMVELKFGGGRIQNMLVKFPKKGLPIQDQTMKDLLQSRIKLISDKDFLEKNKEIKTLEENVEKVRKNYLIPITEREGKSILKKENRAAFEESIQKIRAEIEKMNESLPALMNSAIETTKELVREKLLDFFIKNPSEEQAKHPENSRTPLIKEEVNDIIYSMTFPKIRGLLAHFSLTYRIYDFTLDDFRDNELLDEFKRKKILSENDLGEIVNLKDAYDIKK